MKELPSIGNIDTDILKKIKPKRSRRGR